MIGLRIAGACSVLFVTGCVIHRANGRKKPMPDFLGYLGLAGILGVPVGLILAIFGV